MAALFATLLGATAVSAQYVPVPWSYTQPEPPVKIVVNGAVRHQTMMGGGCSGAFGVACDQTGSQGLSPANQQLVSDYLFNENIGGLSILRNRVGSSPTEGILGSCPTGPGQKFNYTSLGANESTADSCQLKLTRQAKIANPNLFIYADAWSAPGCFKIDATDINGGLICGVRGSNCTQDWRQGYADYLVQYVKFYADKGIKVDMLGAYNEPDFNPVSYASMESDGYQAADFLKVLYPTVKKYRKDLLVSCCDATGARQERDILYELDSAGAGHMYDVATWHNYQSEPKEKFNTLGQPNMQTEWSDGSGTFNTIWDVTGQSAEGTGTITGSDAVLVRLFNDGISVSRRLYAFAGFFRFARPGSVRLDAKSSAENLYVSAYENKNGTVAVVGMNAAHFERTVEVTVEGCGASNRTVKAYLADNTHNNTMVASYRVQAGGFEASMPARSMVTFFLD
ncbi:hypothetical protein DPSP01_004356 [Paraphaeosphaeria sporulosa]|uniref:Glycoside hydrolase family 30 protein n=1 Tax=Paraphaeosphaeria sporulosa TaxID=1460663 RepID=A0A177CJJ2_9PLEO|nr:glycoside hydrolase family 30 protein [Paraphaeosphaeria sporulosa]OAG07142.1 glycoside hydrolase family 30 protein [Paraphaeosphaeria sporulosa]